MLSVCCACECEDAQIPQKEESFTLHTTATIADDESHQSLNYQLEVVAKNEALGKFEYSEIFELSDWDRLVIPAQYGHYMFRVMRPGYLAHTQYFLSDELKNNDTLSFEFIPFNLAGFVKKEYADGVLTIYAPDDAHKCKVYARIDLVEGYSLTHFSVDKIGVTRASTPVGVYINLEKEFSAHLNTGPRQKVNLFGNKPYSKADDYCTNIDYTVDPMAKTLEDINFSTYLSVDIQKMDGTDEPGFVDSFFEWRGANN